MWSDLDACICTQELPAAAAVLLRKAVRSEAEEASLKAAFENWLRVSVGTNELSVGDRSWGGLIHAQAYADLNNCTGSFGLTALCLFSE